MRYPMVRFPGRPSYGQRGMVARKIFRNAARMRHSETSVGVAEMQK